MLELNRSVSSDFQASAADYQANQAQTPGPLLYGRYHSYGMEYLADKERLDV
jgi:hypothetical protein